MTASIPKWREALAAGLKTSIDKAGKDALNYQLATVDVDGQSPRVRTVVHRGFVNERRSNDDVSSNDQSIVSNILLTCTDVRSPKADQIRSFKGQGVPTEICWWLDPTGEQFRVRGRLFMFSPPSHGEDNQNWPGDRFVNGADFNWEQERRRIFDKLSPQLKATFLRPTPGSSWKDAPKKPEDYPEKLEDDDTENKETSLTRFALLAIEPSQIDYAKLKVMPNERTMFTKQGDDWQAEDIVP